MRVFCGKCGKEIPDKTKFCPYCGEATTAASRPSAPGGNFGGAGWNTGTPAPPPVRNAAKPSAPTAPVVAPVGISPWRVLLILLGIAQIVIFFLAPFGILKGGSLGSFASGIAGWFGYDIPERLTGLNMVRLAPSPYRADPPVLLIIIFFLLLPVILSGIVFLINCAGRRRGSYVASIVLSILTVPAYLLVFVAMDGIYSRTYTGNTTTFALVIIVTLVEFAFSIVGCAADPRVKRGVQQQF